MSDLFRFEVPTSRGVFVVIGPDTLPEGEAEKAGRLIAKVLPIMVLPEVDPEHNPGYVIAEDGDRPEPRGDLIRAALG